MTHDGDVAAGPRILSIGAQKGPTSGVRPLEWTGSGCGFDRLPGVLILELRWAQITERGV